MFSSETNRTAVLRQDKWSEKRKADRKSEKLRYPVVIIILDRLAVSYCINEGARDRSRVRTRRVCKPWPGSPSERLKVRFRRDGEVEGSEVFLDGEYAPPDGRFSPPWSASPVQSFAATPPATCPELSGFSSVSPFIMCVSYVLLYFRRYRYSRRLRGSIPLKHATELISAW